jgi:hypothetical protein
MSARQRVSGVGVAVLAAAGVAACAMGGPTWWTGPDPTYDDAVDVQRVRAGIAALRREYRRGPTALFSVGQLHLANARQKIVAEGRNPEVAVEHAIESMVDEGARGVNYWTLKVDRLEDLRPPADLVQPPRLSLAVAILRQRADQHPRYFVVLVTSSLLEHEEPR